MRKIVTLLFIGILNSNLIAQELPKSSPASTLTQVVGLTEFKIEYSRPSAKGRTIFGELVPFGDVWRLGANKCTQFTSSTAFKLGTTELPAATYGFFATPKENGEWIIALNSDNEQWGSNDFDASKNIATTTVKSVENSFTETLVIGFNNLTSNTGVISIQWENLKIDVPFSVNTEKIAEQNINDAITKGENLGDVYNNAANYYISGKDYKKASGYVEKSIALEKNFKNVFLKAKILNEIGETEKAIKTAKKALKMAEKSESKGWANYISKNIEKWSK